MFDSLFPKEWTTLQRLMWLKTNALARAVYEIVTGNPVTFSAKAAPLRQLSVAFSPVQSLNGYDSPWPAGGGKNKFDPSAMPTPTATIQYHSFYVGDGTWTASSDCPYVGGNATVFFLAGNVSSGASTLANGVSPTTGRTQTAVGGYVTVAWRLYGDINPQDYRIQIESGSTITAWTPYSNICPISGWSSLTVEQRGKNLLVNAADSYTVNSNAYHAYYVDDMAMLAGKQVTFSLPDVIFATNEYIRLYKYGTKGNNLIIVGSNGKNSVSFIMPNDIGDYSSIRFYYTAPSGLQRSFAKAQLEFSENPTEYAPYNGRSISISLGQTVYGGTVDVLTGVVKAMPYFASYNGETLVGPWMSSMDKYVAGATPTVGAQVVDMGGTETTIQLTPQEVSSLLGVNNMWTDGDSLTVEYRSN